MDSISELIYKLDSYLHSLTMFFVFSASQPFWQVVLTIKK
jgi:hypothetical protein